MGRVIVLKKVLLALVMLLTFCSVAYAESPPTIYINGQQLYCDSPPVIENGRTLVPMRVIFEALGQSVMWNNVDRSIRTGNIWLQINNNKAYVGDNEIVLDVAPKIIENRTYVPLRFISESLGKEVLWNENIRRIDIDDKNIVKKTNQEQKQYMNIYENTFTKFRDKEFLFYDIARRSLTQSTSIEFKMLFNDLNKLQQQFNNVECPNEYLIGQQYMNNMFDDFISMAKYFQLMENSIGKKDMFDTYDNLYEEYKTKFYNNLKIAGDFLEENIE